MNPLQVEFGKLHPGLGVGKSITFFTVYDLANKQTLEKERILICIVGSWILDFFSQNNWSLVDEVCIQEVI
jgi:hypothetical protein